MMTIREFDEIDQLGELQAAWDDLLARTPGASFFQSLDWLRAYWKHYGAKQRLRVLAVYDGGALAGILPMVVRVERTKVGSLRFLTYPLDYWGSFYGPIGPDPDAVLSQGLSYLQSAKREWDVLELRWIGDEGGDSERVTSALTAVGLLPVRSLIDQTAIIRIPKTWQDYLASRTGKWRNNLKRWTRRLEGLGEISYVRHRPESGDDGDPRWDLFEHCLAVARVSWQGGSQNGTTLSHASIEPFLRDVHLAASRYGSLDLNLLFLNGKPIAFGYNYRYRGHVYGLRVGYDPSVKSAGAGNVLYGKIIADACRRGDWRYDLGPASLDSKRNILTDVLPIYRLSCFRSLSPRQQLLRLKRQWDARCEQSPPALSCADPG